MKLNRRRLRKIILETILREAEHESNIDEVMGHLNTVLQRNETLSGGAKVSITDTTEGEHTLALVSNDAPVELTPTSAMQYLYTFNTKEEAESVAEDIQQEFQQDDYQVSLEATVTDLRVQAGGFVHSIEFYLSKYNPDF